MSSIKGETPAGFMARAAAYALDTMLAVALVVVFGVGISMAKQFIGFIEPITIRTVVALALLIPWLYFAWFESSPRQATFGKRVLGLRVTDQDGNRLGFLRASARFWGKHLSGSMFCLGFFMALFSTKKQALHDMIARTLVVKSGSDQMLAEEDDMDFRESRLGDW